MAGGTAGFEDGKESYSVNALVRSGARFEHGEVEELRHDEANNTEHSNTAVLELRLLQITRT